MRADLGGAEPLAAQKQNGKPFRFAKSGYAKSDSDPLGSQCETERGKGGGVVHSVHIAVSRLAIVDYGWNL